MNEYTYDDLYGIGLDEYVSIHNTTVDELIDRVKIDIGLLKTRFNEIYPSKTDKDHELMMPVYRLIQKKEKHLARLEEWKNTSEFAQTEQ